MHKLIIRKDAKQGFASATRLAMKDSLESLNTWAANLNKVEGWNKYGVEAAA